jgi:N-acetylglucosamine kinase-like BadF-type ATPase
MPRRIHAEKILPIGSFFRKMTSPSGIFLGADIGGTHTRVMLCDSEGALLGFGKAGPGNHESVGYEGLTAALQTALDQACLEASVTSEKIDAAGFGIGGLDWDSQEPATRNAIEATGLRCAMRLVNDAVLGLLAGSAQGWGVAVVSGTGCNCWGWNRDRTRIGHVTGGGTEMGEGAGATELAARAIQAVAHGWTQRGPATALGPALAAFAGARDVPDFLEGLMEDRYELLSSAAPLICRIAAGGDPVAQRLIEWAGTELGELTGAVIRQLEFQKLSFDVILAGSMLDGSPVISDGLQRKVLALAPGARIARLTVPPVVGAVLLAMEQTGDRPGDEIRERISQEACARA